MVKFQVYLSPGIGSFIVDRDGSVRVDKHRNVATRFGIKAVTSQQGVCALTTLPRVDDAG